MPNVVATICPGCGAELPAEGGPTHAYLGSSPECWARYGQVLAREYEDSAYFEVHGLTVDMYSVQHPGKPEPRTVRSLGTHLVVLGMLVEGRAELREAPDLRGRLARVDSFGWLEPPSMAGRLTVVDVLGADTPERHAELVWAWAKDVWGAWRGHREVVRRWQWEALRDR